MKNNIFLGAMLLTLLSPILVQAFQRRVGATGVTAGRGYFARTGTAGLGRSLTTETGALRSRTPISCPTSASRSLFIGSTASKTKAFGTQARQFAGKHSGKLFVAGTAAGTAGAYAYSKANAQKRRKQEHLKEYFDLITNYQDKDSGRLLELIEQLKEDGTINKKYSYPYDKYDYASSQEQFPKTILEHALFSIKDADTKANVASLLVEHGAIPSDYALTLALSRPDIVGLEELDQFKRTMWTPQNKVLKIILPFYSDATLLKFNRFVTNKISNVAPHYNAPYKELKNLITENLQKNKLLKERERALIEKRYEAIGKEAELR